MRLRVWVAGLMFFVSFAAVTPAVLMADVGVASAAPTCVLPAPAGVITLTGDCDTTVPLTIPTRPHSMVLDSRSPPTTSPTGLSTARCCRTLLVRRR